MRRAISDVGIGLIGGYVGTKIMERVSMKLYELESEEDRKREEEVRPGPPSRSPPERRPRRWA
jgi:hypothetical protein